MKGSNSILGITHSQAQLRGGRVRFASAGATSHCTKPLPGLGALKCLFLLFSGMPEPSFGAEGFSPFPQTAVSLTKSLWDVSGDAANLLLAQSRSPSNSMSSSIPGPPMGGGQLQVPQQSRQRTVRFAAPRTLPAHPQPIYKHPASTSKSRSSSPGGPQAPSPNPSRAPQVPTLPWRWIAPPTPGGRR